MPRLLWLKSNMLTMSLAICADLLSALHLPLDRVAVLRFIRRSSALASTPDEGPSPILCLSALLAADLHVCIVFVRHSYLLAEEYLKIGRRAAAGLVLAQADSRDPASLHSDTRLMLQTCYSYYFALLGNATKRSVCLY